MPTPDRTKLKRITDLYAPYPLRLVIDDSVNHQLKGNTIALGSQAPYRYLEHYHPEGYQLMLEGLLYHELARARYTDFACLNALYQNAKDSLRDMNQAGRAFLDHTITYAKLRQQTHTYVLSINLPLVVHALEEGALDNAMGIAYPETWTALMNARQTMTHHTLSHPPKTPFLMDQIIAEIMLVATYGYRYSLKTAITQLPLYLPDAFEAIRQLAIRGRLLAQSTPERVTIAKQILTLCTPVLQETVKEILDTILNGSKIAGATSSLFDQMSSEIAISFQAGEPTQVKPEKTPTKYALDLSQEELSHLEAMEDQDEKKLAHERFAEIHRREQKKEKEKQQAFRKQTEEADIEKQILLMPLSRTTPTADGQLAKAHLPESIARSNRLARLFKREQMYASKSQTKHHLAYGRTLDTPNLYRANLDGHVFKKHKEGQKKDLCVYILVDNSESMSGQKIINTMKGCYELARVMQTLKIPFAISAHKALGSNQVQLTRIIEFQESSRRYLLDRIFTMHPSGGTHEDIALEYVLKELANYKRKRKGFVFVLSDGDTHGVRHIHELCAYYHQHHQIDVIGIGIQTAPLITQTYPNGLFIEDIQTLPEELMKLLRQISI